MGVEQYEKWKPMEGISTPVSRALIKEDHEGLSVTLVFSEIVDGLNTDLRINFGRVPAYTIYEEFVHPWNVYDRESPPKLEGKWESWSFPMLIVKNSNWLDSFSDSQLINYPASVHYRLVTLNQTVDIVCNQVPEAYWLDPQVKNIEEV